MNTFLRLAFVAALATFGLTNATALPLPPSGNRDIELMKCTSAKQGTLWASFGHLLRSGQSEVTFFPTELVVFQPDLSSRLVFHDLDAALKVPVRVGPGRIALEFDVRNGDKLRHHHITLVQYDPRITNSYSGNWEVTDEGQPATADAIWCTAD